ncbi:MAG: radical SAM family heme chaperone HemW [Flavobacteriales bacterium]|nr:radical SAM family heme chaperone HemW [Flavobacteriales bacterium]
MAGIYIHIPFCRRACHYCDFHFTTNLKGTKELTNSILTEVELRKNYIRNEPIETIYFGGGTPSLLASELLFSIIDKIRKTFTVKADAEITLEANPEDLSGQKLEALKAIGINRLSLGTQSFIDKELLWMNRMHTAKQAEECIALAQHIGFSNISIDLIFGLPDQTEEDWKYNLKKAISLNIQHISSYALTVEGKTVLSNRIKKGEEKYPDENSISKFFTMNMKFLLKHGFEHYEISNFARSGFISKHNSSYWQNAKYLGLGPSAHSFNGISRQWNIRSNAAYISALKNKKPFFEKEELSINDRLNEHILTGLRTKWGVKRTVLESIEKGGWKQMLQQLNKEEEPLISRTKNALTLTDSGKLMADRLSSDLFF